MDDDLHRRFERLAGELDESPTVVPEGATGTDFQAAADEIAHLERALKTRTEIGRALGIVMERFGIDTEKAFALLVRLSQHSNRKLVDVCHEVVDTRVLPKDPSA